MIRRLLMLPVLVSLLAAAASATEEAPDLLWPLPIEPAVSSNFCEYREGHFHAGIDIRTFGQEGVPCLAAGAGYVSRVRCSPRGYGKAVYIQLDGGQTLVYSHLSEFSQELEEAVAQQQLRRNRYTVDFRPAPTRFPVSRGDVIGYSGQTGATAPHLHFEIRDAKESPLNPFSHGFSLPDRLNPEFERVLWVPLSVRARVNGECYPLMTRARKVGTNSYTLVDTVHVEGEVGLAVEVVDRLNADSGRLAPYGLELSLDGAAIAGIELERFSFGHTDQIHFLYDIDRVRNEKSYFVQLFERTGETLWHRTFQGGGRVGVAHGDTSGGDLRDATVTAVDRAGNQATLTIPLVQGPAGAPRRVRDGIEMRNDHMPGFYFFENLMSVRHDGHEANRKTIDDLAGLGIHGLLSGWNSAVVYTASQLLSAPVETSVGGRPVYFMGFRGGEGVSLQLPALSLQLVVGEATNYGDQVMYATTWSSADPVSNGELVPRSESVLLGPYTMGLGADFELRFLSSRPGGLADTADAIYRLNEKKNEWSHYRSVVDGAMISTTARRPGVYAVLSDEYAPEILRPFTSWRRSYATGANRPEIVVPIGDAGSGVDDERCSIYLNGVKQIARWDGNAKKMFVIVKDQNIMGTQAISIVAYDKIGNRSQLDTTIEIPK